MLNELLFDTACLILMLWKDAKNQLEKPRCERIILKWILDRRGDMG
jgi:hypothetical protein